ncbi:MAG: ABC transporter ATP-binding protein [bacterium]|nr:ABC transporter ATP-binding protein [bacterium]
MSLDKKKSRVGSVLRIYGKAVLVYPWLLTVTLIAATGIELAWVTSPLYLREFIDLLSKGAPSPEVVHELFFVLLVYGAINLFGWFGQRIRVVSLSTLVAKVMVDLYQNAFDYLLGHSHDFFISNFTGTLTRRVSRYALAFEQVLNTIVIDFFSALLFSAGVIIILSLKNILLGAGLLTWTAVFVYLQYRMQRSLQPLRVARMEEDSKMTGFLSDTVLNHSAVTAFASARYERSRFKEVVGRWYAATRRIWNADALVYGVQGLFAVGINIALLAGSVLLWERGVVTVGDFVLIQVYVLGLMDRVWGIGRNMRQLYAAFADATEMYEILELPHAIQDVPGAKSLEVREGSIAFDNVRFEYQDSHEVLKEFDLTVRPHEKVALVGSSGAGKSTIAKLLMRLYDVSGGSISIDGQNIAQVTQESLRKSIALVPQEPILFHRSLLENIRYGRSDATDEEVVEAATQANCQEFISHYPDGFATMVGERGVKLSGGERQRVAIARAILKNAPILLLDEATSSLDSESERLIQDALARLMKGKTVIAIAHRLSTITNMDRLIVMEKGSVALTGTHDELLAHKGNLYRKLWEIQAGSFIRED